MKSFSINAIFLFIFISAISVNTVFAEQSDTISVSKVEILPIIDGMGNDTIWNLADWQFIDMVWLNGSDEAPLNTKVDSSDFMGKFKVLWSETTNLLYIQVVTVDDGTFDFGYTGGSNYPSWDGIEIFIDEDRSGGLHLMDGTGQTWGIDRGNGENAFAYHILPKTDINPSGTSITHYAIDLGGDSTNSNPVIMDYSHHLNDFAVTKSGDTCTWELSLEVYDDTYDYKTFSHYSRVTLTDGKIMGFSIAYNDDDDDPFGGRDNMYGSIRHINIEDQNASYYNADVFGVMRLEPGSDEPLSDGRKWQQKLKVYPNPVDHVLHISASNIETPVIIEIWDITGNLVLEKEITSSIQLNLSTFINGFYCIRATENGIIILTEKLIVK